MEPDKLMDEIAAEMSSTLKTMGKAKTPEEKLMYSEVVKNLSESLGVFINLMTEMAYLDEDNYDEDEDEDEDEDYERQ